MEGYGAESQNQLYPISLGKVKGALIYGTIEGLQNCQLFYCGILSVQGDKLALLPQSSKHLGWSLENSQLPGELLRQLTIISTARGMPVDYLLVSHCISMRVSNVPLEARWQYNEIYIHSYYCAHIMWSFNNPSLFV